MSSVLGAFPSCPLSGRRNAAGLIHCLIRSALGRLLLKGEVRDGQVVEIDYDAKRGQLTFTAHGAKEANADAVMRR